MMNLVRIKPVTVLKALEFVVNFERLKFFFYVNSASSIFPIHVSAYNMVSHQKTMGIFDCDDSRYSLIFETNAALKFLILPSWRVVVYFFRFSDVLELFYFSWLCRVFYFFLNQ